MRASRGAIGFARRRLPSGVGVQPSPVSAPRSWSKRRARSSAAVGGASSHASVVGSRRLHAASSSSVRDRSTRSTSGSSCSRRPASSARDQSRTQRPGPRRPARPARWVADERLMPARRRRSSPVRTSKRATRASPESTTAVTPSTVSAVSATLVASTTRRRGPARSARACSSSGCDPCSVQTSIPDCAASGARARAVRRISAAPGRNTSTSPGSAITRRTAASTRSSTRSPYPTSSYSIATGCARPSDVTTPAPGRCAATAAVSTVADITTRRSSGRTVSWSSRTTASATSLCKCRSWNSSSTTTPTRSRNGSRTKSRANTPSVRNQSRVASPPARANRTRYPTSPPTRPPRSRATNSAAARAATRRGSITSTSRAPATPASSNADGTRVVFPAPGAARNTTRFERPSTATTSGNTSSIGNREGIQRLWSTFERTSMPRRTRPPSGAQRSDAAWTVRASRGCLLRSRGRAGP